MVGRRRSTAPPRPSSFDLDLQCNAQEGADQHDQRKDRHALERGIDGDGTDDQTDILKNALVYVKKRPVYKSRYYQTGYPDDRYGVCTDVVGYALKKSGYDLRELVDEDIRKNPKDYDIDEPDKNIDFRRVKNLRIYFEHTATSLTTDVNDIEQWQGGDIVVFKNHIGVISDRRNVEGVPYVIHHNDPYQKNYEEDILQERTDIVGHFRIS